MRAQLICSTALRRQSRREKLFSFLKPALHVAPLPEAEVVRKYLRVRWQILEATFIGYATFYLVREFNLEVQLGYLFTGHLLVSLVRGIIVAGKRDDKTHKRAYRCAECWLPCCTSKLNPPVFITLYFYSYMKSARNSKSLFPNNFAVLPIQQETAT